MVAGFHRNCYTLGTRELIIVFEIRKPHVEIRIANAKTQLLLCCTVLDFVFWSFVFVSARPGADFGIALLQFLQTKTKYTVDTMWPVWARGFVCSISDL
jgi:hypothetical protein